MKIKNSTVLKDALHNFASNSGASTDYCGGIAVGIVSGLMSMGLTFDQAIEQLAINFPDTKYTPSYVSLPESWQEPFWNTMHKIGKIGKKGNL